MRFLVTTIWNSTSLISRSKSVPDCGLQTGKRLRTLPIVEDLQPESAVMLDASGCNFARSLIFATGPPTGGGDTSSNRRLTKRLSD
jgi:hypothetical protein